MHIERHATLRLSLPPAAALPHFTPEGERAWVPGWDPVPLHAPDGSLSRAGAVFTTAADGEPTLWLVLEVDLVAHAAAYVRITPGNRLGTVHVRCREDGAGGTLVEVDYRLTAISEAGVAKLATVTPEAFAAAIAGWQRDLERLLAAGSASATVPPSDAD
ncbi:MAG: SRPBCC family protein [Thermoanaerobaculia bacterium]|nr:SRPBCC family protein [Thermoanaerobaculia bacterium]